MLKSGTPTRSNEGQRGHHRLDTPCHTPAYLVCQISDLTHIRTQHKKRRQAPLHCPPACLSGKQTCCNCRSSLDQRYAPLCVHTCLSPSTSVMAFFTSSPPAAAPAVLEASAAALDCNSSWFSRSPTPPWDSIAARLWSLTCVTEKHSEGHAKLKKKLKANNADANHADDLYAASRFRRHPSGRSACLLTGLGLQLSHHLPGKE